MGARELERVLSKAGVCSRAQARAWIRAGRVRVNGARSLDPDARLDPERDVVTIDGRRLRAQTRAYWALHKPRGHLTTRSDPDGRPTVYDLLGPIEEWVIPVGRLDLDTSGLLLLTNDTRFADRVTSPASHVPKTYRVEAEPRLGDEALERLRRGVVLKDGPTRPAVVKRIADRGPRTVLEITITEGRNRQVRRMVREVGSRVEKLVRISIGPVALGDLAPGAARRLSPAEVRALLGTRSTER